MSELVVPLSGELIDHGHRLTQRVYYEDTDFSGLVYHARYLHFLERGRTDYLRCLGCEQSALLTADEEGLVFVVHRMEIDFKTPARMDDVHVEARQQVDVVAGLLENVTQNQVELRVSRVD